VRTALGVGKLEKGIYRRNRVPLRTEWGSAVRRSVAMSGIYDKALSAKSPPLSLPLKVPMHNLLHFLRSKTFFANLAVALVGLLLLVGLVQGALNLYTRHGRYKVVPQVEGMSMEAAIALLKDNGLKYEIIDSARFNSEFEGHQVVIQFPPPEAQVKRNRAIKLTVNPIRQPRVAMPDLIEKTERRAKHDLESRGLIIGKIRYVPNIAKDVVLDVRYKGQSIKPGTLLDPGTALELVLGQGLGDVRHPTPVLFGLGYRESLDRLKLLGINVGVVVFDTASTDTPAFRLYRQIPDPRYEIDLAEGAEMDLWFTQNLNKIPTDTLPVMVPDSASLE